MPEVVAGDSAWLEVTVSSTEPVSYEGGPSDCDHNVTAIAARTEPWPSDPPGPRILTIEEAAHALLSDPRVLDVYQTVPIDRWGSHALEFIDGAWYYLLRHDGSRLLVARADGHTGEVLDVRTETRTGL